jgi:hypothetical protein
VKLDSLASVSEPAPRRLGRLPARERKPPSERDWERSTVLEPRPAPRHPELVSDGAALAFSPHALVGPSPPLDPEDPAARALLKYLVALAAPKGIARALPKRGATAPEPPSLAGWRQLAREGDEVLFGRGLPPQLLLVTLRKNALRRSWTCTRSGVARPLRATRAGIRASSWRLDPTHELGPEDSALRLLLTEQAFASGQTAQGRLLAPDLYLDGDELVLRMFVTPRPGYQTATRNPETPVRVALPEPLGQRPLSDGALLALGGEDHAVRRGSA